MTFDPVQCKSTTRQQWEDAADAWHRWGPTLETWLGPVTEKMLDAANVTTGARCSISRGWVPIRRGAVGGTAGPLRYFFTVLGSSPSSSAITFQVAPASRNGLSRRRSIHASGGRIMGGHPSVCLLGG